MPTAEAQTPPRRVKTAAIGPESINQKARLVTGYISTVDVDMVGDVVLPEGMDDTSYFASTRSVNLFHNQEAPVGVNRALSVRPGKGVYAVTYIGKHALGEDTLTMIEEGIIRAHSIEWDWRTLDEGPPTVDELKRYGPGCKNVFRKWTLTRYAFCPNPMNPYAVIDGVKSDDALREREAAWKAMEALFTAGRIHRSSAVAAGFPDSAARKVFRVTPIVPAPKVWRVTA
jgi:hypothetical protein